MCNLSLVKIYFVKLYWLVCRMMNMLDTCRPNCVLTVFWTPLFSSCSVAYLLCSFLEVFFLNPERFNAIDISGFLWDQKVKLYVPEQDGSPWEKKNVSVSVYCKSKCATYWPICESQWFQWHLFHAFTKSLMNWFCMRDRSLSLYVLLVNS